MISDSQLPQLEPLNNDWKLLYEKVEQPRHCMEGANSGLVSTDQPSLTNSQHYFNDFNPFQKGSQAPTPSQPEVQNKATRQSSLRCQKSSKITDLAAFKKRPKIKLKIRKKIAEETKDTANTVNGEINPFQTGQQKRQQKIIEASIARLSRQNSLQKGSSQSLSNIQKGEQEYQKADDQENQKQQSVSQDQQQKARRLIRKRSRNQLKQSNLIQPEAGANIQGDQLKRNNSFSSESQQDLSSDPFVGNQKIPQQSQKRQVLESQELPQVQQQQPQQRLSQQQRQQQQLPQQLHQQQKQRPQQQLPQQMQIQKPKQKTQQIQGDQKNAIKKTVGQDQVSNRKGAPGKVGLEGNGANAIQNRLHTSQQPLQSTQALEKDKLPNNKFNKDLNIESNNESQQEEGEVRDLSKEDQPPAEQKSTDKQETKGPKRQWIFLNQKQTKKVVKKDNSKDGDSEHNDKVQDPKNGEAQAPKNDEIQKPKSSEKKKGVEYYSYKDPRVKERLEESMRLDWKAPQDQVYHYQYYEQPEDQIQKDREDQIQINQSNQIQKKEDYQDKSQGENHNQQSNQSNPQNIQQIGSKFDPQKEGNHSLNPKAISISPKLGTERQLSPEQAQKAYYEKLHSPRYSATYQERLKQKPRQGSKDIEKPHDRESNRQVQDNEQERQFKDQDKGLLNQEKGEQEPDQKPQHQDTNKASEGKTILNRGKVELNKPPQPFKATDQQNTKNAHRVDQLQKAPKNGSSKTLQNKNNHTIAGHQNKIAIEGNNSSHKSNQVNSTIGNIQKGKPQDDISSQQNKTQVQQRQKQDQSNNGSTDNHVSSDNKTNNKNNIKPHVNSTSPQRQQIQAPQVQGRPGYNNTTSNHVSNGNKSIDNKNTKVSKPTIGAKRPQMIERESGQNTQNQIAVNNRNTQQDKKQKLEIGQSTKRQNKVDGQKVAQDKIQKLGGSSKQLTTQQNTKDAPGQRQQPGYQGATYSQETTVRQLMERLQSKPPKLRFFSGDKAEVFNKARQNKKKLNEILSTCVDEGGSNKQVWLDQHSTQIIRPLGEMSSQAVNELLDYQTTVGNKLSDVKPCCTQTKHEKLPDPKKEYYEQVYTNIKAFQEWLEHGKLSDQKQEYYEQVYTNIKAFFDRIYRGATNLSISLQGLKVIVYTLLAYCIQQEKVAKRKELSAQYTSLPQLMEHSMKNTKDLLQVQINQSEGDSKVHYVGSPYYQAGKETPDSNQSTSSTLFFPPGSNQPQIQNTHISQINSQKNGHGQIVQERILNGKISGEVQNILENNQASIDYFKRIQALLSQAGVDQKGQFYESCLQENLNTFYFRAREDGDTHLLNAYMYLQMASNLRQDLSQIEDQVFQAIAQLEQYGVK